jgi:hypothetical protein
LEQRLATEFQPLPRAQTPPAPPPSPADEDGLEIDLLAPKPESFATFAATVERIEDYPAVDGDHSWVK